MGRLELKIFDRTLVMGILNVTPDSFYDGGMHSDTKAAVEHALRMIDEGADIIDIGGESSRPGARSVPVEKELGRVLPVVKELAGAVTVPLSIDTYKPKVAQDCIKAGASIINDITGLGDAAMRKVAAEYGVPAVVMHMKGTPSNMQDAPAYADVIGEINEFFRQRILEAHEAGVEDIILDPGIGFGKTVEHNFLILRNLRHFRELGHTLLVGVSRKSFIRKTVNESGVFAGSIAATALAAFNGADIVRVHDIAACRDAVRIADALR
ncbi:MAG: dihydropteroate synthase [Candidatus Altiarchaeota archaeon]|nr:dihydropteroate synthase [Candidatus Altiarchaeota archaeon]